MNGYRIYKVRIRTLVPGFRPQFMDGLYVCSDYDIDVDKAKETIVKRVRKQFQTSKYLDKISVEVTVFRRASFGFIISEISDQDLEDSK